MPLTDAPFFASLPAQDIERARRWYEEKLGLTPLMDLGPAGLLYQTGRTNWLMYQTPSAGTGKHTLGGWAVPHLDETMRDLRA
ncbi:MAG: VOC family protein, partial [Chloroflexota bacterium]